MFSELNFENCFGKFCMGVDGVDRVDLPISFFSAVRFWFLIAHVNRLDETRKMGQ